jgi:glutamyl-tRNA synthetase
MADGRFAPSPTGSLHLGNLRTALVAWLFARSAGSRFLLRVDDLDAAASRPEHEASQLADLAALGLDWDGEVVHQSSRRAAHDEAIDALTAAGLTYPCTCTRREVAEAAQAPHEHLPEGAYPGTCAHRTPDEVAEAAAARGRPPALRLRAEGAWADVDDRLHGHVRGQVDDFVVRRNDGTPAYNLAVVVDDAAQGVEEVVRGDDLLPGTPRQVHLARVLGLPVPAYAHVALVVGPDGGRMAKRHGATTLAGRAALGQGPAAVRGLLAASLGLARPGEEPTPGQLVARFDPAELPKEPWVLDGDGA